MQHITHVGRILAAFLLLLAAVPSFGQIKLDDAIKELTNDLKQVRDATTHGDQVYGKNAQRTLEKAGMPASFDTWGGWFGSFYGDSHAKGLLGDTDLDPRHAYPALWDSIAYLRETKYVNPEDMAYLRDHFADWTKKKDMYFELMDQLVQNWAQSAQNHSKWGAGKPALEMQANETKQKEIDAAGAALQKQIATLYAKPIIESIRLPLYGALAERKDGLLMGLEHIRQGLGFVPLNLNSLPWERVNQNGNLYALDTVKLKLVAGRAEPPTDATPKWMCRRSESAAWTTLTNGQGQVRLPDTEGPFYIEGIVAQQHGLARRTGEFQYNLAKSSCQTFFMHVLIEVGDGAYLYRTAKATTQTYQQSWDAGGGAPTTIAMAPDPATGKPYEPENGDVVLRSAGYMSYVQHTLGHPRSPANHTGVVSIMTLPGGERVPMVNEIEWGYKVEPLTPADAKLCQKYGVNLPGNKDPNGCFIAGANIGTVSMYRPSGVYQTNAAQPTIGQPAGYGSYSSLGSEVAARAAQIGANVKAGYDLMFLESCSLADEEPFKNLYYCHEYTNDCFGHSMAKPVEIPLLKDFWQAAIDCDRENAAARMSGKSIYDPGALADLLASIDVDQLPIFDNDPATKEQMKEVIQTVNRILRGDSFEQILTLKVSEGVRDKFENSVTSLTGIPKPLVGIVEAYASPGLAGYIQGGSMRIASYLVQGGPVNKGLFQDLGDAIDATALLNGGHIKGAHGEDVTVSFHKISQ